MPGHTTLELQTVQDLYDRGLYLRAYEAADDLGRLRDWRGAAGRVLAGRLAGVLGSDRLSIALHWLAHREHPGDEVATYFAARTVLRRWGPYFTLRWQDHHDAAVSPSGDWRAEWLALRAVCHAKLRDRARADHDIAQAREMAPDLPWLAVEHATVLEDTDRYPEALAVIQQALEGRPDYRPAVQAAAHLLVLSGREDEALELLQDRVTRMESGLLHCQLAALLRQCERLEEAREQYEVGAGKLPLMDRRAGDAWLARIRSDLASACGDPAEALALLQAIPDRYKGYFHGRVEKSLATRPADAGRRRLEVPFIRQHYRTCAPATLAMLARYFGRDAEHLEIADAICFDGTPYHAERTWAESAGYHVAEFTIDLDTAVALIDRGLPFTFSTVEPNSGHLQAVIGYDTARRTLLLRDPFYPSVGEILADSLPERYGAFGPRGMVMVPPDKAHLLEEITLPDRELWALSHQVRCALLDHRRDEATQLLETMRGLSPDAVVTLNAELTLADYDNDAGTRSRLVELLIERYPECPAMVPRRLACMSEHGLRHKRLELLRAAAEQDNPSSYLLHRLADELAQDGREHGRAAWRLRRLIRMGPLNGEAYHSLGGLMWTLGDREEATRLYHTAACIEDKREHYAMTLFRAQRFHRREQETIALLRERFDRLGDKHAGPARTLYEAYRLIARADQGFGVLDEAIERRPEDGHLMLFAAEEMSAYGLQDRAAGLLERARPRCRPMDWRRSAASLAEDAGRLAEARDHWRAMLDDAPLDLHAHRRWCALTRRIDGVDRVVEHLRGAVERFPHHWDLQQQLYFELSETDPPAALTLLRELIRLLPNNAWAWRELGFVVSRTPNGLDEARAAAEQARVLSPSDASTFNLLGWVAELSGDRDQADRAYRDAVRLDPDGGYAIHRLVELHDNLAGRRAALAYIFGQLAEQVTFGEGVLAYQRVAGRALEPDQVLAELRRAVDERPDLWQCWAALIEQLIAADKADEAPAVAEEATDRFPLIPNIWMRRAEVHRVRLERHEHIRCLEEVLRITPGYSQAVHQLALAHEYAGEVELTENVVRKALDRDPRNAGYHARLAELLWNTGRRREAVDHIEPAVRLTPDYQWAWDRFCDWADQTDQKERPGEVARELTRQRPAEPAVWLSLAQVLHDRMDLDERLGAIDKCLTLNPRETDAYDLKARLLVGAHRFDEALAACDPPVFAGRPPCYLRGRGCWVDYQRGNYDKAIKGMWQVVREEPTYAWGLRELIAWCGDRDDTRGQIEASDMLIRADPNDHIALGYRGWARTRQSEQPNLKRAQRDELRTQAKADFERAIALDPGYDYAAGQLFNMQLADNQLDEAERTLSRTAAFLDEPTRLARQAALACKRGDKAAAERELRALCCVKTDEAWAFHYAYKYAEEIKLARTVFGEMVGEPQANPLIGELVVAPFTRQGQWGVAFTALRRIRKHPGPWDRAAGYLLNALGEAGDQRLRDKVAWFCARNRKRLLESRHAWEGAVYALASMDLNRQNIKLFGDWRQRESVAPWMLCNLANAYLGLGRLGKAREVIAAALAMPPDHSVPRHLIDLAHCDAVAGDASAALQTLAPVVTVDLPPSYQFTYQVTLAVAHARNEPSRRDGQRLARDHLREARKRYPGFKQDRGARRAYQRAVWAIGRAGGPVGLAVALGRLMPS